MKKSIIAALACLSAFFMLLPVVKTVNHRSVNNHTIWSDGIGAPAPPFPIAVETNKFVADGIGAPAPPFPIAGFGDNSFADGIGAPAPPFPVAADSNKLVADGIEARGPIPADSMFHAAARQTYDAALCMYHDQALIPIKTLAFDHAVNVTLGLPFVRTSPDHGTAFDIAGKGLANPASLIAAVKLADRLTR